MKKPRLAIVSTFDDLCGIAGYTRCLLKQIENDFDVEVFDLDQFFMRSNDRNVRRLADKMIRDFCRRAKDFDCINIQLEHGTLGKSNTDIIRRFGWIARAAPALTVTFHTILPQQTLDFDLIGVALGEGRIGKAISVVGRHFNVGRLNRNIYGMLRGLAKRKPVRAIVHTRRDMRLMRYVNRLPEVFDHPLAFFTPEDAAKTRAGTTRGHFPLLDRLPQDAKIIGVFGFLSEYKGFDTVVRALQYLPDDHHLVFFGGLHPNEIRKEQKINPYVKRLLDTAYVEKSVIDDFTKSDTKIAVNFGDPSALLSHPKYVGDRIHFMGAQTDEDFARGMCVCDHVVLPYLEVGQSSSGPMSIAVEMGARVIAARNAAFLQFARYHPDTVEFFEIGNFLELAERILARPAYTVEQRRAGMGVETNREIYRAANAPKGK
jgi:glycosyltransferase involved in cell wall biosynthesis